MRRRTFAVVLGGVMASALALSACSPAISQPGIVSITREAQVQSVDFQTDPAGPIEVTAVIRGNLTETCATLSGSQVEFAGTTFTITVDVASPTNGSCQPTMMPFETKIGLNTKDLPAGAYTVVANGVSAVFTLPLREGGSAGAPTTAPTTAPTSAATKAACTDAATFIEDVSVPDNSVLASNAPFTKTWRLKNSGTCTWDNSYLVSYISGATMTQQPAYWILQSGQTVAPGQYADVSVGMTSPPEAGSYTSYWGLKRENGSLMPIKGGSGGNSFYVKIKVGSGSGETGGQITGTSIEIVLEQGSGTACTPESSYFVTAFVSADGPITAAYEIGSTAGQIPAGYFEGTDFAGKKEYVTGALEFVQAETKHVALHFVGPYAYPDDITVFVRVNGGPWHNTKLDCN